MNVKEESPFLLNCFCMNYTSELKPRLIVFVFVVYGCVMVAVLVHEDSVQTFHLNSEHQLSSFQ